MKTKENEKDILNKKGDRKIILRNKERKGMCVLEIISQEMFPLAFTTNSKEKKWRRNNMDEKSLEKKCLGKRTRIISEITFQIEF